MPLTLIVPAFQVHYWERDRQNQTEKVQVIFVPNTRVHLVNLTSYTSYLVTLSAFNMAGDGPPSDPRGTRTLQAGGSSSALYCSWLCATSSPFPPNLFVNPPSPPTCRPAPSQPSFLSFSEVTGGSVNVSWGAPLSPNGQLEGYRVIYQHTAPVQGLHAQLHTH